MKKAINAGVHAAIGFEFQKHCALLMLIENYNTLEKKDFFISLEHYDDLIFGYFDNKGSIQTIDAYQVKKSGTKWTLSEETFKIIAKMVCVGVNLKNDTHPKVPAYSHKLYFGSNASIDFKVKKDASATNVTNKLMVYNALPVSIKTSIEVGVKTVDNTVAVDELKNVYFTYFDFAQSAKSQIDQLVGAFGDQFGDRVHDHRAAIMSLMNLFRDVELALNQGNIASLLDPTKRVSSNTIRKAIGIIESKQMAFNIWRQFGSSLAKSLTINVLEQKHLLLQIQSSFDLFKDTQQFEHQKILKFVYDNAAILSQHVQEDSCIDELFRKFQAEMASGLPDSSLKAAIIAAYIEVREANA